MSSNSLQVESLGATAKKLISPKSSNFFVYTNVPKVENTKQCPICGEEAPKGETHHPHYGGICCYSCRAFFRRAHQRTKVPKFTCKKDGNCPIIAKEKHLCKRCRYEKCKSVGMDSKWVLSNEEERIRFEKFFKKKDEEQTTTSPQKGSKGRKPKAEGATQPAKRGGRGRRSLEAPDLVDSNSSRSRAESGKSYENNDYYSDYASDKGSIENDGRTSGFDPSSLVITQADDDYSNDSYKFSTKHRRSSENSTKIPPLVKNGRAKSTPRKHATSDNSPLVRSRSVESNRETLQLPPAPASHPREDVSSTIVKHELREEQDTDFNEKMDFILQNPVAQQLHKLLQNLHTNAQDKPDAQQQRFENSFDGPRHHKMYGYDSSRISPMDKSLAAHQEERSDHLNYNDQKPEVYHKFGQFHSQDNSSYYPNSSNFSQRAHMEDMVRYASMRRQPSPAFQNYNYYNQMGSYERNPYHSSHVDYNRPPMHGHHAHGGYDLARDQSRHKSTTFQNRQQMDSLNSFQNRQMDSLENLFHGDFEPQMTDPRLRMSYPGILERESSFPPPLVPTYPKPEAMFEARQRSMERSMERPATTLRNNFMKTEKTYQSIDEGNKYLSNEFGLTSPNLPQRAAIGHSQGQRSPMGHTQSQRPFGTKGYSVLPPSHETPFVVNMPSGSYIIQRIPKASIASDKESPLLHSPALPTASMDQPPTRSCQSSFIASSDEDNVQPEPRKPVTPDYNNSNPTTSLELSKLSSILDSFTLVSGKLNFDSNVNSKILISNHLRQTPLEKSTVVSQLTMIAKMVAEFAMSQFMFTSLSKDDQITLLKNNAPLYVQYILARYFHAETGMEQLSWLLEGQVPISIEDITNLKRITFPEYNSTVNFIPSAEKALMYSHHIDNIGLFYPFPENCNGLIANLLLYHTTDTIARDLSEPKRVSCIFEESKELVISGCRFLDRRLSMEVSNNIRPLINTLTRMKEIFESCFVPKSGVDSLRLLPRSIDICYTDTEESWVRNQFSLFQDQCVSVSPPRLYIEELVELLKHGTTVGPTHIPMYLQMTSERMRRVVKIHPEFTSLPRVAQEGLLAKNLDGAVALTVTRLNLVTDGKNQLKSAFGYLDPKNNRWEERLASDIDFSKLRKAHLKQQEVSHGKFDSSSVEIFESLFKEISHLASNEQLYQLFTLISLLDTEGMPDSKGVSGIFKMRQIYLKLFQRKLHAAGSSFVDYARFRQALSKLKFFAGMMVSLYGST